jgi:cbb3-type cytochrome oxidase maturation protein|nr:cbb3-type cytochrome oxidase assembly protein CcoS [Hydrotalea lipotrueae]
MTKIIWPLDESHILLNRHKILLKQIKISLVSVIVVLLVASISVAALFLAAFLWSVKSGQYNDEASPPIRILFNDAPITETTSTNKDETKINNEQKIETIP